MRAFRLAVGTFVVQAKDIRAEQFDADAIVNVVNQVQDEMENMVENFQDLKKSVFKGLDADNNGFITKEELQAKVKQYLGPDPVPVQVAEYIFNVLDMNRDNQLEADEIVEGVPSLPLLSSTVHARDGTGIGSKVCGRDPESSTIDCRLVVGFRLRGNVESDSGRHG